jgi:tRNA pseudouridine38-40 synthase
MPMQRLKCTIAYDGTLFAGYQIQPNKRTIQEEFEKALKKLHKENEVKVYASGRTDARVHAKGQVLHFDTSLDIPLDRWSIAINSILPLDISVLEVEKVPANFHARFDAQRKEYRYFIYPSPTRDPFKRNYATFFPNKLNLDAIREALPLFLGTHDFSSFCAAKTEVQDKIRTIYEIELLEEDDMLVLRYVGSGFLYNMVRIMTGTLLEIGIGNRKAESITHALMKKDRSLSGKTAPAEGLYLWKVLY